ncbi:MAG TPA: DUF362 domain-containing protein, partial [Phycisphaerae bacterium]|nr:DUF362 domain-containing protein [Phycisphaerae bacterium]
MGDERLTRREYLARGTGAVVAAGAAAVGGYLLYDPRGDRGLPKPSTTPVRLKNYFADVDFPASNPRISIATVSSPVRDAAGESLVRESPGSLVREPLLAPTIEKLVRAAVDGLDPARGMTRFISPGDAVLIKPNVGFDRPPHLGATTHPEVLRCVIRLCLEAGARKVVITDNPIESPAACFTKSGIQKVADEEGVQVVLPARNRFEVLTIRDREPNWTDGEALGRWPIFYEPLAEATKLIGVAPIKDHNLASAS